MSDPFRGKTTDDRAGEMGDFFRGENGRKGDFLKKMLDVFVAPGRWIDENIVNPMGPAPSMPGAPEMTPQLPEMAPEMPAPQMGAPMAPQMPAAQPAGQPQNIEEMRRKLQRVPF